jgi:Xaa-Pro aminopeptidase
MNAEITKPRREALACAMEANQLTVVFAKLEAEGIEKFSQDNNFLYFTGLNIPEAVFCVLKTQNKVSECLFIQRGNPEREVWDGKKLSVEEARQVSGIEVITYLEDFYSVLSSHCPVVSKVWSNIGTPMLNRPLSHALFMLDPIRKIYPNIVIENINNLIRPLRSAKSDWEVEQLQAAIDITGQGIKNVMQQAQAGMMEYELEAILYYELQKNGVQRWGFAPIIASGINAATLHYKQNNCQIQENEVVLLDVGASYLNYSADLTRCFPISGKFSPRQRQVYAEVLAIQQEIILMMKPGVGLTELNEKTNELMQQALIRLGLIEDPKDFRRYYMHSIGHHIGLDTHDLGARDSILEVGSVITIEPGIYIPEENLGIRIEDDILITETGYRNLSQNIPKEIEQIEKLIQDARS